nr:ABC transporter permease [Dactylosporangium thailandense]
MKQLLRRAGVLALVLFLVYTLVFVVLVVLPGDPISNRLSDPDAGYTPQTVDLLKQYYGVDKPAALRYAEGLLRALHGDLGHSLADGQPVTGKLADAFAPTLELGGIALLVVLVLTALVGLGALYGRIPALRVAFMSVPSLVYSLPVYLVAVVFIQAFSFQLGWVPLNGEGGFAATLLPACVLGITISPPLIQVFVRSLITADRLPHITVARARGIPELRILTRHLLPGAALPSLTVLGITIGYLMSGAVVTETVFTRYGLGALTQKAVQQHDQPVLLGIVVVNAAVFMLANLLVDVVYPRFDPRVQPRFSHAK